VPDTEAKFSMRPIHTFAVVPSLPRVLEPLRRIAYNLRWSWDHDTIELFRRLDSDLWESSGHNPIRMLGSVEQRRLQAAASNDSFVAHMERVAKDLGAYLSSENCWCQRTYGQEQPCQVAYFSAEFGLTECLSIFAGGLGILAGDHLKSASDLGVPIVGIGLLYQQGYFRQYLNDAGWQQESYQDNDFHNLPLTLVRKPDGGVLSVSMDYPGRRVIAQVWRVDVGRVPLYLLDTNTTENPRPTSPALVPSSAAFNASASRCAPRSRPSNTALSASAFCTTRLPASVAVVVPAVGAALAMVGATSSSRIV